MYDKIIYVYPLKDCTEWGRCTELKNFSPCGSMAELRNLKIKQTQDKLILSGSLQKFFLKNNVINFSFENVYQSVQELSELLKLNLNKGFLQSVEVGQCLIMNYQVYNYLKLLGQMKNRYKRNRIDKDNLETVYFTTKTDVRKLMFYDKMQELKDTRHLKDLDSTYGLINNNSNLLRIEYRVKRKGIKETFNKDLKLQDMLNKNVLSVLSREMLDLYESVEKGHNQYILNPLQRYTIKDVQKIIMQKYFNNDNELFLVLNERNQKNLKEQLRENKKDTLFLSDDLVVEMTQKLKERLKNYINE